MAIRLQSAPSVQPLNKDCLHTTRTTHQQNWLLVLRCVALISKLLQRYIKTRNIHSLYTYSIIFAVYLYDCIFNLCPLNLKFLYIYIRLTLFKSITCVWQPGILLKSYAIFTYLIHSVVHCPCYQGAWAQHWLASGHRLREYAETTRQQYPM